MNTHVSEIEARAEVATQEPLTGNELLSWRLTLSTLPHPTSMYSISAFWLERLLATIDVDRAELREAREKLATALRAVDYVADEMPGFDGISWEAFGDEVRCILKGGE